MTAPLQDTRYGTQRLAANLPKKNTRGQVVYGPEPAPKPRAQRGNISIRGKRFTAKQALKEHPKLLGFLQLKNKLKQQVKIK